MKSGGNDILWKIVMFLLGVGSGVASMLLVIGEYKGKVDGLEKQLVTVEGKVTSLESYNRSLVSELLKLKE